MFARGKQSNFLHLFHLRECIDMNLIAWFLHVILWLNVLCIKVNWDWTTWIIPKLLFFCLQEWKCTFGLSFSSQLFYGRLRLFLVVLFSLFISDGNLFVLFFAILCNYMAFEDKWAFKYVFSYFCNIKIEVFFVFKTALQLNVNLCMTRQELIADKY